jgi:gliding motility-associated-like protein
LTWGTTTFVKPFIAITALSKGIAIKPMRRLVLFVLVFGFAHFSAFSQLYIQEKLNETLLVKNVLLGDGMEYRNVVYTGYDRSMGYFENGLVSGLGIDKGIILSSGVASGSKGPNNTETYTSGAGGPGVKILDDLAGTKTIDASMLEFEFRAQTDHIRFRYVFSSDEYIEWVDKGFNDVFGFFVSGPGYVGEENVALVPGTSTIVAIDNINHKRNTEYYVNNGDASTNAYKYLQHDGATVVLQADIYTTPCEWYKIKMAIADVGDPDKDSWVFLEAKSFKHETGLGEDEYVCTDTITRTLYAGHDDKKVRWFNGDTSHSITVSGYGTYWVEIFTNCGSFKDEIVYQPALDDFSLGRDTSICEGEMGPLLLAPKGYFDAYKWSDGGTDTSLQVIGPGMYWLQLSRFGCTEEDSIVFTSKANPRFSLGADTTFCGDFSLELAGISGDKYLWSDGSAGSRMTVDKPGMYWLELEKGGCAHKDSIRVTQLKDFSVEMGPNLIELCAMRPITLNTGISNTSRYSFLWSTGDTVPSIIALEPGRFSVMVKDKLCPFEHGDEVEINALSSGTSFLVPNAFSPTNDELNDVFRPVRDFNDILFYQFIIFNRWGEKVFFTEDPDEGWNGEFEGKEAPIGTYFWYARIKTTCLADHDFNQYGTVQILR